MNITIYTGEKHSGKTTFLQTFYEKKLSIGGILSPIINGIRCFQPLHSNESIHMESTSNGGEMVLQIGKYTFSQASFEWAIEHLYKVANNPSKNTILIDELGPLELKGLGFAKTINEFLDKEKDMIWVVRRGLVQDLLDYFQILNSDSVYIEIIELKPYTNS
ncbi:MAG: hypothetical protein IPQ18_06595 [Saprospiraceae bacterium]|jgi:nucleoside-triphosphatase THEP1|nr:hypothetical protein [Saprospiraceae bacterium]MBL0294647.1 hypothetical protein [Saprospiraceae bacterium]